mgnify:CR=1 FL=1
MTPTSSDSARVGRIRWARGFFRMWVCISALWCLAFFLSATNSWRDTSSYCQSAYTKTGRALVGLQIVNEVDGEIIWKSAADKTPNLIAAIDSDLGKCRELAMERHRNDARTFVAVAVIVPAIALALGVAIGWILTGFRSSRAA